jgi:hypothetical protein
MRTHLEGHPTPFGGWRRDDGIDEAAQRVACSASTTSPLNACARSAMLWR